MDISPKDRSIIRDLAKRVAEIAGLPVMAERRKMWTKHNALQRVRPMILVFPEGAWRELITPKDMQCESAAVHWIEWSLRSRIYTHEHIHDDKPVDKGWVVGKVINSTSWGVDAKWKWSSEPLGARAFDPVILEPADLKKFKQPEISVDEQASQRSLADFEELFGDILEVRQKGISSLSYHLMNQYTGLRGLEQVMVDMIESPGMLHDAMAFLEQAHRNILKQYVDLNLLSLNNDGTYHSSGGLGYTDELPAPGFDQARVRPCDIWASAEAQELALVSPGMHEEFSLQYERRLLAPFGLNGYGCCEDLTRKLDYALTIPNIRRMSIAPAADVDKCAEKLGNKCIFSWKPQPAYMCGRFDAAQIREYIKHTLDVTKDCVIEMILKDTHTCDSHPERFTIWTDVAQELAAAY